MAMALSQFFNAVKEDYQTMNKTITEIVTSDKDGTLFIYADGSSSTLPSGFFAVPNPLNDPVEREPEEAQQSKSCSAA